MALSAVVLPAPFGPISPRMRPSSTRISMPSSAIVVPNDFRRPRASMHAMASALLLRGDLRWIRFRGLRLRILRWPRAVQQLLRFQAKSLDGCMDPRPFFAQKFLSFALQQHTACAHIDEHAEASSGLDQSLIHELLIA